MKNREEEKNKNKEGVNKEQREEERHFERKR